MASVPTYFYKVDAYVGYAEYNEQRHYKLLKRGDNNLSFSINAQPLRLGLKRISFYLVHSGGPFSQNYHEYFSGLPVNFANFDIIHDVYKATSPKRLLYFCAHHSQRLSLSAVEFEKEVNKVSPNIRNKIVSRLTDIYEKACHEAELYEHGEKKIRAQLQKEAEAEKAAAERLSRKTF